MDGENGAKTIVYNTKMDSKKKGTEKKRTEKKKREQKVEEVQQQEGRVPHYHSQY